MIIVEPLKPHERPHCAYCDKPMLPNGHGVTKMLVRTSAEPAAPEEHLATFRTNRRVVRVRRHWHGQRIDDNKQIDRKVTRIDLTFFPDDSRHWGYDGLFCTAEHGRQYAHAAHKAGYRMKGKSS